MPMDCGDKKTPLLEYEDSDTTVFVQEMEIKALVMLRYLLQIKLFGI